MLSLKDRIAKEAYNLLIEKNIKTVNFGYGIPLKVYNYLPEDTDVMVHGESGILGCKGNCNEKIYNSNIVDPAGVPAEMREDGVIQNSALDAFAFISSGSLDATFLGAFEVSEKGDIANNATNDGRISGFGGARDLCKGSKDVVVCMIEHTRAGSRKLVKELSYPSTANDCVTAVVTDRGVYQIDLSQPRESRSFLKTKEWDEQSESYVPCETKVDL